MMLAVNLLPWRLQQWQRRRQQSFSLLGGTLIITLIVLLALWWRGSDMLRQQQRLDDVSQMRDKLQQQLTLQHSLLQQRDALLQAHAVRQQQQREHQRWQQFWQQLPTLMPDALWLNRVERRQGLLLLEGQALSMRAVRDFRQQLTTQLLFANVKPGNVQRQPGGHYRFALQARVKEATDE